MITGAWSELDRALARDLARDTRSKGRRRAPAQRFACGYTRGYTLAMKTAISLPDELFREADLFAEELGWSRSQLYATALREYLRHRSQHAIREALDAVYTVEESGLDEGLAAAQAEIIEDEGW